MAEKSLFAAPEDLSFRADLDGTEQKYILLLPKPFRKDKKHDLLFFLHGHGSDRRQCLDPRSECAGMRAFAGNHGMIVVSPDYRALTSWMGPAAEADMLQLIAEMKKHFAVSRVFLSGGSMGGSSSLTFGELHPALIDGITALNPLANHVEYQNFQDAIAASFGGPKSDPRAAEEYRRRSAEFFPEQFTMPVAITAGANDTSVPPESCRRLAGKLKSLKRKVIFIENPAAGHETDFDDTVAALEFMLSGARKA